MTDPRLEITATPRPVDASLDLETPLYTLAWQAIQRWGEELDRVRQGRQAAIEERNRAWIVLADECFNLRRTHAALTAEPRLGASESRLELSIRRLEQALECHGVEIDEPVGSIYSPDLAEVLASVEQLARPDIEEPLVHEVLLPVIRYQDQVIRFGKAIVAVPDEC